MSGSSCVVVGSVVVLVVQRNGVPQQFVDDCGVLVVAHTSSSQMFQRQDRLCVCVLSHTDMTH